jgi:uncharacterized protein (DUF433 family)
MGSLFLRKRYSVRFLRDPLDVPNYGYEEAVRYLHIPHSTLSYWLRSHLDLVQVASRRQGLLSFRNLVECYVLNGLREIHKVRLPAIRQAMNYMLQKFESRHPLADYDLQTDGRHIYFWHQDHLLNITLQGQIGMKEVLDSYLRRIERDWQRARWAFYPFMRLDQMRTAGEHPKVVVLNPNVCFGMPTLSGTRITTSMLASRHLGGDSITTLARSYGRPETEIQEAILWETGKGRAAA